MHDFLGKGKLITVKALAIVDMDSEPIFLRVCNLNPYW
jgi:hypothetical protein